MRRGGYTSASIEGATGAAVATRRLGCSHADAPPPALAECRMSRHDHENRRASGRSYALVAEP
jgi:hypothetical protein